MGCKPAGAAIAIGSVITKQKTTKSSGKRGSFLLDLARTKEPVLLIFEPILAILTRHC